jgi:peptidoglycan-associated lipoprotein
MISSVRTCAAVLLAAGLVAGACAKKKPEPPAPAPTPPAATPTTPAPPPAPPPPAPAPAPRALTEDEIFDRMTLDELNQKRPLGDVFFAYDSIQLSDEARGSLQKNSEWMKRWARTRVTVEGHADSRGTNEYNLALAERRAGAVRDYLVGLGVGADRMAIVSKGEEQPFCTDETESCWQQNRRGHFLITAK